LFIDRNRTKMRRSTGRPRQRRHPCSGDANPGPPESRSLTLRAPWRITSFCSRNAWSRSPPRPSSVQRVEGPTLDAATAATGG